MGYSRVPVRFILSFFIRCRSPPSFRAGPSAGTKRKEKSMSDKTFFENYFANRPKRAVTERVVGERGRNDLPPETKD